MLYFIRRDMLNGRMLVNDRFNGRVVRHELTRSDVNKSIEFLDEQYVLEQYPKFFCTEKDFKIVVGRDHYEKAMHHARQAEYSEIDAKDASEKLNDKELSDAFKEKAKKHRAKAAELKKTPEYKAFIKQQASEI